MAVLGGSTSVDIARGKLPISKSGSFAAKATKHGLGMDYDSGSEFFDHPSELTNPANYTVVVVGDFRNMQQWNYSGLFYKTDGLGTGVGWGSVKVGGTGNNAGLSIEHKGQTAKEIFTKTEIESGRVFGWHVNSTGVTSWMDGIEKRSDTISTASSQSAGYIKICSNRDTHDTEGTHYLTLIWDRELSDAEMAAVTANPYTLLKPATPLYYYPSTGAGGGYTLAADGSSFTFTAQDATLKADRKLTAATGSFTYTAQDAGTYYNRVVSAEAGSFAYTAQDANLLATRLISAEGSSFTFTAHDATLTYTQGYTLVADSSSFAFTAQDATLKADRVLGADGSTFTFTAHDATLSYTSGYTLVAESATYTGTAQDASLLATRTLSAESSSFSFAAQDATLRKGFTLTADVASYTASAQDATLTYDRVLSAESAAYVFTAMSANLNYSGFVPPATPTKRALTINSNNRTLTIAPTYRTLTIN